MNYFEELEEAIRNRLRAEIVYSGSVRIVEPHLIGVTFAGNTTLSAFQVSGSSGDGFRAFVVDRIEGLTITEEPFHGPRQGYNPNDSMMETILVRL